VKVEKTITVTVTGYLTVTISAPDKIYTASPTRFRINWTPYDYPPFHYVIDWGDGSRTDDWWDLVPPVDVTKAYSSPGSYKVTVTVTDNAGQTGSASMTVNVANPLKVTFQADSATDRISGKVPFTVKFSFTVSDGFPPYTITLDPGDGSAPIQNPTSPVTYTYNKVGTFTAKLTVVDALGATAAAAVKIATTSEVSLTQITPIASIIAGGLLMLASKR
jgi:PKD repeat protein